LENKLKNILFINTGGGIGDTLSYLPTINCINEIFNPEKIYYYATLENFWFEDKLIEYKPKNLVELKSFPNHFGFSMKHFFRSKNLMKNFNFERFDLIVDNQTRFKNSIVYKRIPHRYYITPCLNYFMSKPFTFMKKRSELAVRVVDYVNKIMGFDKKPNYKIDIPDKFLNEAKRLIPNKNFIGFSITAANPKRVKSFNIEEIIKVANFYSDKYTPTFFIEHKHKELINLLKIKVKKCYIPEEETSAEFQKPILVTALGKLTKFNISINNGISHMLSFSQNKNFIFNNQQSNKWKPANDHTFVYECGTNNTTIDKLSSDTIIDILEKN
tara:strand:+ start:362 stop:1345 length:984 start_codon:yes stop_codon:yes gene_type:complete